MTAEQGKIVARLRLAAAIADAQADALRVDAAAARALADDIEGPSPPTPDALEERGRALFVRPPTSIDLAIAANEVNRAVAHAVRRS